MTEADITYRYRSPDLSQRDRVRRLGNAGTVIKNVKDALGSGCRFLRVRDDTAHRIQSAVEAADVGDEGHQHTDRDTLVDNEPDAECPDYQQPDFGQHRDCGRKQAPCAVELVVHGEVVLIGIAKALRFARFLCKGLHHPYARNRVGQYIGYISPDTVNFFEAIAQPITNHMNQPDDQRQRHQGRHGKPRVDGEQHHRRHRQQQHIGCKIQRMQRQEHADAVGFIADPRDQVAGSLRAEIIQ